MEKKVYGERYLWEYIQTQETGEMVYIYICICITGNRNDIEVRVPLE